MTRHILLEKATRRPFQEEPEVPPGANYERILGHWLHDGTPLVNSEEHGPGGLVTKKCDQETGEDQKGE